MVTVLERASCEAVYYNFASEGPVRGRAVLVPQKNFDALLAVAKASAEREAAERAYLEAHTNPDVDVLGDAAERLQAAIGALKAAIAPLMMEVTE